MEKGTDQYEGDNAICCGLEISVVIVPAADRCSRKKW